MRVDKNKHIRNHLLKKSVFDPIFIVLIILNLTFIVLLLFGSPNRNINGIVGFLILSLLLTIYHGYTLFSQRYVSFRNSDVIIHSLFSCEIISGSNIIMIDLKGKMLEIKTNQTTQKYLITNYKKTQKLLEKK